MYCAASTGGTSTRVPWMIVKSMHVRPSSTRSSTSKFYQSSHSNNTQKSGCLLLLLSDDQPTAKGATTGVPYSCDRQFQLQHNTPSPAWTPGSVIESSYIQTLQHWLAPACAICTDVAAPQHCCSHLAFYHTQTAQTRKYIAVTVIYKGWRYSAAKAPTLEGNPLQLMNSASSPPRASGAAACAQLQAAPRC